MEKKLKEYYQSLVEPALHYGPQYEYQEMLDGTDVEVLIRKKRAHKTIMAEAFSNEQKIRRRAAPKKPERQPDKRKEKQPKTTNLEEAALTDLSQLPDFTYGGGGSAA